MRRCVVPMALLLGCSCWSAGRAEASQAAHGQGADTTEVAAGSVSMIADVLSGVMVLRVKREGDGSLTPSYNGRMCFAPTSDARLRSRQNALIAKLTTRQKYWREFVRQHADTDHSGVVSDAEAAALRLGFESAFAVSQLGITNAGELARASWVDPSALRYGLRVYMAVRAEAQKLGREETPELPDLLDLAG
jgi:hypothetical protein